MIRCNVRRVGPEILLGCGIAAAVAMTCGIAHAAPIDSTVDINGWTVQPVPTSENAALPDTLLDPANALRHGTEVSGAATQTPMLWSWIPVIGREIDYQFDSPSATLGVSEVNIGNFWMAPWREDVVVSTSHGSGAELTVDHSENYLFVSLDGKQVVDMLGVGDAGAPLFNPEASGPINVGGFPLASPQDGALLNNLFDAVFTSDAAAWGNARTLFDEWLGIDPVDAAGASSATAGLGVDGVKLTDTGPGADLLSTASTNLTDANTVLSGADLSDSSGLQQFVANQTQLQDTLLHVLGQLGSAESAISAHDGSLSSLVDQLLFDPLNQGWANTTEGILTADQAFDSALAAGTGAEGASLAAAYADIPALWDFFSSFPVIVAADFF